MTGLATGVRVEADGAVGALTLDRPERLNALDVDTLRGLVRAAEWFEARRQIRAVVVSGAGRAFCAGFDLSMLAADATTSPAAPTSPDRTDPAAPSPADLVDLGRAAADAIASMSAVTVAAAHGPCVGGGLVLVLACDLRVADADAAFSLPETRLGIPLAWGGVRRLVREVGPAVARDLILTGRTVNAEDARAMGLVGRVVPPGTARDEARAVATRVAGLSRVVIDATLEQVARATEALLPAEDPALDVARTLAALGDPESAQVRGRYLAGREH